MHLLNCGPKKNKLMVAPSQLWSCSSDDLVRFSWEEKAVGHRDVRTEGDHLGGTTIQPSWSVFLLILIFFNLFDTSTLSGPMVYMG